jgi:hypothetical protein
MATVFQLPRSALYKVNPDTLRGEYRTAEDILKLFLSALKRSNRRATPHASRSLTKEK